MIKIKDGFSNRRARQGVCGDDKLIGADNATVAPPTIKLVTGPGRIDDNFERVAAV